MEYKIQWNPNPSYDMEVLKYAFDSPLCGYMDYNEVNKPPELQGSTSFLWLLIQERHHPGLTLEGYGSAHDRILKHLRNVIGSGHEPSLKGGPIWGHPICAGALTLAKFTPSIWNELSEEEINRIDWIMKAFVVHCSWCSADQNDFHTGPCLQGNYNKHWNPNHRSPHILPILYATKYFGSAEAVNDILIHFDYRSFMKEFQKLGFTNMLRTWAPAGPTLFEEGGDCYLLPNGKDPVPAGHGKGVKFPYVYEGMELKNVEQILNIVLLQNTEGGKVVNAIGDPNGQYAYLLKGSSPVLGMDGMMSEFNSKDALGMRSCVNYCSANFCILMPTLSCFIELGMWDPKGEGNQHASQLTTVSVIDYQYKIINGYHCFQKGHASDNNESCTHGGYKFSKDLWIHFLKPEE